MLLMFFGCQAVAAKDLGRANQSSPVAECCTWTETTNREGRDAAALPETSAKLALRSIGTLQ
jgi:hypothetical protein